MATDFGNRLRAARLAAGLTQKAAEKATGIPQSTISTAEREGVSSTETTTYAKAYGVNAHWLATGDGEMMAGLPPSSDSFGLNVVDLGFGKAPGLETTLSHLRGHLSPYVSDSSNRTMVQLLLMDLLDGKRSAQDVEGVIRAIRLPGQDSGLANERKA